MGKRCGFTTLLVMTGITMLEELEASKSRPEAAILPDFYADRLADLLDCLVLES